MKNFFSSRREIARRLSGGKPVVFLDYDGTLARIRRSPEKAVPSRKAREAVGRLARNGVQVVLVTGRTTGFLEKKFPETKVVAEHGAGWPMSRITRAAGKLLEGISEKFPGSFVEWKKSCACLHYRNVEPAASKKLEKLADSVLEPLEEKRLVKVQRGKRVFEVMDFGAGDKGGAVRDVVKKAGAGAVPVVFGDDSTDEAAFTEARRWGGVAVLVGNHSGRSAAEFFVKGVGETIKALEFLNKSIRR